MSITISKGRVSLSEAKKLVEAIKLTPYISAYSKSEWLNCKNLIVARENQTGELMGACLNDDIGFGWTEIAALFVFDEFRSKQIGYELFYKSLADCTRRNRHVLIMSNNPRVIQIIKESGLKIFNDLEKLPSPFDKHKFVLTKYYDLRWLLNLYRQSEVRRKKKVFGKKASYIYGLKLRTDTQS